MLQVAILSDTHGQLDPRIAELVARCDLAVHGGDIGNAAVLGHLKPRSGRVRAVLGNNDTPHKWPAADLWLLEELPLRLVEDLPGGRLVVLHGHETPAKNRHARLRRDFPDARAIVYGHSHRLIADQEAEPWVLNPGAAGRERTFGGPSCMVLRAGPRRWSIRAYRFPLGGAEPGDGNGPSRGRRPSAPRCTPTHGTA